MHNSVVKTTIFNGYFVQLKTNKKRLLFFQKNSIFVLSINGLKNSIPMRKGVSLSFYIGYL